MSLKLFEIPKPTITDILNDIFSEVENLLPEWTDRSELDPGVVLARAFATITYSIYSYMQVYHDNFLIKFGELLGITPETGTNSIANVTIRFERVFYPFFIREGTRFATHPLETGTSLVFSSTSEVYVPDNNSNPQVPVEVTVPVKCQVIGTVGNVPKDAIRIIIDPLEAAGEIISSSEGIGGKDEDNYKTIQEKILSKLSASNRAVTKRDYEDLVNGLSYVRNCYIWAKYNPNDYLSEVPGNIGIIPIPEAGFTFDDIKDQLLEYIKERAVLTANIFLINYLNPYPPTLKEFEFELIEVRIFNDHNPEIIRHAIKTILETKFSPYEWRFGKAVTLSDIYNAIFSIDGIKELISVETSVSLPINLMHFQTVQGQIDLNSIHIIT